MTKHKIKAVSSVLLLWILVGFWFIGNSNKQIIETPQSIESNESRYSNANGEISPFQFDNSSKSTRY